MWSVDVELIEDWLDSLDKDSWQQVTAALDKKHIPVADDLFDHHRRTLKGE